ncbi:hypothetical protein [Dyadobacter arcticus]|uniref:FecR protein domain-containing protein n=1 Tax=Dyadobacter arcticus TaxID=1078754 RepID=A0ABX0UQG5_9BACT|nr:hypothetical protein [Dyadobacter arcticus]NIJ53925.1 hypothetical protein [Dyadobacter arcticus]
MKVLTGILFSLIVSNAAFAQEKAEVYKVKNGSDLAKIMPYADRYQYEQFMDGEAFFRGGRSSKAKFNYSYIHGEVMFIAPNKDTMLLTETAYIDRILVSDKLYYFLKGNGHIQVTGEYGKVKLGKKLVLIRMGNEKYASYDQYSSTSSIASYSSYTNANGQFQFLEGRDKVVLGRRASYFLIDANKRFYPANRPGLMKIFPSNKSEISSFLKENDINLEKVADLIRTLEFCATF